MSLAHRVRQGLFLIGISGAALPAQGRIDGVLFDSTRALAPLANAEVVLLDLGRRVTTDRRGRFTFADVPAGTQRVAYAAPWLDSIGAPPLVQTIEVPASGRARAQLVTTPRQALELAECGTTFGRDVGLLVGQVFDASQGEPAAGVVVRAQWMERHLGRGLNEVQTVATVDTADGAGRYALCGVPLDVDVTLSATHDDGRAVDDMLARLPLGVTARDLVVSDGSATMVVEGRVTGPSGDPMPRANVATSLSASRPFLTDSSGRFRFVVPARSGQVLVRTLGYQPRVENFAPVDGVVSVGDIVLEPVGAVLDTRTITATPRTREEAEFNERRLQGMGAFLDSTDMALWPRITASAIAAWTPSWVRAAPYQAPPSSAYESSHRTPFPIIWVRCGMGYGRPVLWVDGQVWGLLDPIEEYNVLQRAKRIEIYRPTLVPARFAGRGDCGALVVWTR